MCGFPSGRVRTLALGGGKQLRGHERVKEGETLTVTERGHEVARLVPSRPGVDPYYLTLAEEYGATIPTGDLLDAIKSLPPLDEPAPAGTTDAFLEESRRGEFGPR